MNQGAGPIKIRITLVISTKNTAAQLEIKLGSYPIKRVTKKTTLNLIHEFITLYDNLWGIKLRL
jgi:hypothetical protein